MTRAGADYAVAGFPPMHETLTNDDAQYPLALVKKICEEVGPGFPGRPEVLSLEPVMNVLRISLEWFRSGGIG